jgi:hypothetical protein
MKLAMDFGETAQMDERKTLLRHLPIVALLSVAGCQTDPPPKLGVVQDIEFLQGCWVAGGIDSISGFLRLLPPSPDALAYVGETRIAWNGSPDPATRFSFTRDGVSVVRMSKRGTDLFASGEYLSVVENPVTPPAGMTLPRIITYVHPASPASVLTVEYYRRPDRSEGLLISVRNAETNAVEPPIVTDFSGDRGICD